MRKLYLCIGFCLTLWSAMAQDPNFSQFFASPLTLNPALTGKFDGDMRFAANYRNQWPTINNAFTTYTASLDFGILKNRIPVIDQFGVGFLGFSDRSGNGILQSNAIGVSTAYHKGLDEDAYNQLGLGFQAVYVNKRLDVTKLDLEDELTPFGFTGTTQDVFPANQVNVSYFDVNAGILYNGTTNGLNNIYAGVSVYHINQPKESFKNSDFVLEPRMTFQAGYMHPINSMDALHLSANYSRQANATNTVVGGAFMKNLNADVSNPTNLYMGSWIRFGDAIIPYVGLEVGEFHFGFTYDVNISSLKPASNTRGGAEASLIYIRKHRDPNARKLNCPKF
ncbi:PorP/SprF family type IX secretion system membrane protein [Chitinophagaceae bacterium LB-8]|uniref:PorP/SprF family type IX secretion system membrane protein n=1 Tax=Paraflavisolibacter caeni TaxID=2982496 RepID=A0A9X3B7F6_9BACT|nr:PorP/SprF family type IX secretion system membrane protein [Paraflavisolibacter caeni]MCU7548436.1 PorP/SprF family type IX secretion system membrane protein [Paraflavisolibacter caeni]